MVNYNDLINFNFVDQNIDLGPGFHEFINVIKFGCADGKIAIAFYKSYAEGQNEYRIYVFDDENEFQFFCNEG